MVAGNQRYVFYALKDYRNNLKRGGSEEEWKKGKKRPCIPCFFPGLAAFPLWRGPKKITGDGAPMRGY